MASHGGSAAFDSYTSSRSDGKRKFDDPPEPNRRGSENNRVSYNSVPPPLSDFELAKQRAQQIAARLVAQDTKRTRTDGTSDDTAGRTSSNEQHHVVRNRDESHDSESHYDSLLDSIQFRKLEIPNTKVGLIIGRGGETIKYLQQQSGAKIQVARDADTDVNSLTRNIELTGFPDQLSRAEQLIKDVMAEADARGPTAPSFIQGGELLHLRIPSNKVGLVIGRGGETIRSLQSKSGAHIQLVPLQGEEARFGVSERTLTLTGSKEQIQVANDMIMEMISEYRNRPPPPPMSSGGYHQQQPFRLPGPPGQWGPPGPSLAQQGYGYQQPAQYRGPPQYLPPPPPLPPQYGGHSQQASTDFGWNQPQFGPNQPQHNYYNQQSQPAGSPYASQSGDYIQEGPYTQQGYSQQGSNTEQFYGQQGYSQVSYASGSIQDYGPPGTNYNQLNDSEQPGYGPQASTPQDYGHQMNYGQQESVHQSSVPSGYTQQEAMTQMYVQKNSSEQSQGNNELTNQAYSSSGYNDQPYGGHQPSHESHGQQESKQQDFEQLESSQSGYLQQSLSEGYKQQNTVEYAQQGSNQPGYGGQSSLPKSYTGQPVQGASHSNYVQLSARQQGFSSQSFVNQESGQSAFGTRSHQDSPSHGHEVVQPGYGSRGTGQQGSSHQSYPSKGPEPDYEQQISTQYTSGQGHEVTHGQHPYPEKYGYACTPQTSTYEGQQDSYYHQPNDQAGGGIDGEYNNTNASEG